MAPDDVCSTRMEGRPLAVQISGLMVTAVVLVDVSYLE